VRAHVDKDPFQDQVTHSPQLPLPPGAARALACHFGELRRHQPAIFAADGVVNRQTKPQAERPVLSHSDRKRTGRKPPNSAGRVPRRLVCFQGVDQAATVTEIGRKRTGGFGQSKCRTGHSRLHNGVAALDPKLPLASGSLVQPAPSQPAENHAQIVCGHLGDHWLREPSGLRHRCDRFEVSQAPGRLVIANAPIERFVAGGGWDILAFVWSVEIERRRRRQDFTCAPHQSNRRLPRGNVDHVDADDPVGRSDRPR
jgi:hypothetical protein